MADPYTPFGFVPPRLAPPVFSPPGMPPTLTGAENTRIPASTRPLGQRLLGGAMGLVNPLALVPEPFPVMQSAGQTLTGQELPPQPRMVSFDTGDPQSEAVGSLLGAGPAFSMAGQVARGIGNLAARAPRLTAGAAATAGLAAPASTQQPLPDPTAADRQALQGLLEQRGILQGQAEAARKRRERERSTGEGKRYDAAKAEFDKLNNQLQAMDESITELRKRTSPEYRMKLEKQAYETQQRRERERAESGWVQSYPWLLPVAGTAGLLGGGALSRMIASRGVRRFNTNIDELTTRWRKAVKDAEGMRPGAGRDAAIARAESFRDQFQRMTEGPGGWRGAFSHGGPRTSGSMLAPAIGTEVGVGIPTLMDEWHAAATPPGSPAREAREELWGDWASIAGRFLPGIAAGTALGKGITAATRSGVRAPLGFTAETAALRRPRPDGGPPTTRPAGAPPPPTPLATLPDQVPTRPIPPTPPPSTPLALAGPPSVARLDLQRPRPPSSVSEPPPPMPRSAQPRERHPPGAVDASGKPIGGRWK